MIIERILTADFLLSQGFSLTIVERFWGKVDKNGPLPAHRPELGPCWIWTGLKTKPKLNTEGYGQISRGYWHGGKVYAHRLSWILHFGAVPKGLGVLHKCDHPPCVNPVHLWVGTHLENMGDMARKGRGVTPTALLGEDNPCNKLTEAEIKMIRESYGAGVTTQRQLATTYAVSQSHIHRIIHFD